MSHASFYLGMDFLEDILPAALVQYLQVPRILGLLLVGHIFRAQGYLPAPLVIVLIEELYDAYTQFFVQCLIYGNQVLIIGDIGQ